MRNSLMPGKLLPETMADFVTLRERHRLTHHVCIHCGNPFHTANVTTADGWAETQISGMCELCWHELFEGDDDEP